MSRVVESARTDLENLGYLPFKMEELGIDIPKRSEGSSILKSGMAAEKSKPYYKVIWTGHIYEVYEMEKEPVSGNQKREEETGESLAEMIGRNPDQLPESKKEQFWDDFYTEQGHRIDRKAERRKQTLRDARNNTRRLCLTNFDSQSYFMTLTVQKNSDDVPYYDDEVKKFFKRLRYKFGDFKYIGVREFQNRGAIHYHFMISVNLPLEVPNEYLPKKKNKWVNEVSRKFNHKYIMPLEQEIGLIWGHGFVDLEPCKHIDNVGAYLIKYMTKGITDTRLKGKKAYLSSKGLNKPTTYRGYEAELIINTLQLNQKKETFTNSYDSEYLGKITYKEYNIMRMEW